MHPFFVVLDGIDGTGKSTQIKLLARFFEQCGLPFVTSREPTDGKWGKIIRASATTGRLPLDQELDYFIKDRDEHIATLIKPALNSGKSVILDRYFYSTICYQGARGGNVPEIERRLEGTFLEPHITLILDCEISVALDRIKKNRKDIPNEFEQEEYLKKVRDCYLYLNDKRSEIKMIDATGDPEDVHHKIVEELVERAKISCMFCSAYPTGLCLTDL